MNEKNIKASKHLNLAQPEGECVLSNATVFAQLERVPTLISAGRRLWHLQHEPAEEPPDASSSLHKAQAGRPGPRPALR